MCFRIAIWQRARTIIAAVAAALIAQLFLVVYVATQVRRQASSCPPGTLTDRVFAHRQARGFWDASASACMFTDTQAARNFYTATLCVDAFLLVLMLAGLLRLRDARKHGLWKFLWRQVCHGSLSVIISDICSDRDLLGLC